MSHLYLAFMPHSLTHSLVNQSFATFIFKASCLPQCPSLSAQGLRRSPSTTYSLCPHSVFRRAGLHIPHAMGNLEQEARSPRGETTYS